MQFFRDESWGAVSAIAALLALSLAIIDRRTTPLKGGHLKETAAIVGFFLIGAGYGPFTMTAASFVGFVLNGVGIHHLNGTYGDIGDRLSHVKFLLWGFNQEMPPIQLQMSAVGLWFGGFLCGTTSAIVRYMHIYTIDTVPRAFLVLPLVSFAMIIFIGMLNSV
jgi:hypothetical protein